MSGYPAHINEFEFYYLVELTRQRIKPLSRWEKPLPRKTLHWLKRQGFAVETVPRKLLNGRLFYETVFSTSARYTNHYYKKFAYNYMLHSLVDQKQEGFLFGYPSCCVKQFIEEPYKNNGLEKNEQARLFHWACPDCRTTRDLIPYYLRIYDKTKEGYEYYAQHNTLCAHSFNQKKPWRLPAAITTFLLSTGILTAQSPVDSTHIIPMTDDSNQNNLSYSEEIWLGHFNMSTLSESQKTAKDMAKFIDSLPPEPFVANPAYRVDHLLRGVFQCARCDSMINMGYVTIINPYRKLQIDLPYMALHFMQHGSFTWANIQDSYYSRVDIDSLKRIIDPYDLGHMLTVANDSDGDGLTDAEEDSLWINYTSNMPDFDGDSVPDGAQVAEELIHLFPKLKEEADGIHSHITYNLVFGLENCKICGSMHNMGTVTIDNPENGRSYEIPIITLHAMAHGSFAYDGTVHEKERANVIKLVRAIKTHSQFIRNDDDMDGLKNNEETKFGYDPKKADSDANDICDGKELALKYVSLLKSLPVYPRLDGPYTQYFGMDGIHRCSVCGKEIIMGMWQIYNPLINTVDPLELSEYALHFLEHGSFAYEGPLEGRTDPQQLADYLGVVTGIKAALLPENFKLYQNYPNPFNPVTTIEYEIQSNSHINLSVYNLQGQKLATLVNKKQGVGNYKVVWDASALANGVYFYKLVTDKGNIGIKKLIFLK